MNIKTCPNGHNYDSDVYSECPGCSVPNTKVNRLAQALETFGSTGISADNIIDPSIPSSADFSSNDNFSSNEVADDNFGKTERMEKPFFAKPDKIFGQNNPYSPPFPTQNPSFVPPVSPQNYPFVPPVSTQNYGFVPPVSSQNNQFVPPAPTQNYASIPPASTQNSPMYSNPTQNYSGQQDAGGQTMVGNPDNNDNYLPYQTAMPVPGTGAAASPGVNTIAIRPKNKVEPVAGWLVCIKGKDKGNFFPFGRGQNSIGRNDPTRNLIYKISLSDEHISRSAALGSITFDDLSKTFFISPGSSNSNELLYRNRRPILETTELCPFDRIMAAKTSELLFIPFCSESFSWDYDEMLKNI